MTSAFDLYNFTCFLIKDWNNSKLRNPLISLLLLLDISSFSFSEENSFNRASGKEIKITCNWSRISNENQYICWKIVKRWHFILSWEFRSPIQNYFINISLEMWFISFSTIIQGIWDIMLEFSVAVRSTFIISFPHHIQSSDNPKYIIFHSNIPKERKRIISSVFIRECWRKEIIRLICHDENLTNIKLKSII